jgi:hypothetical protein
VSSVLLTVGARAVGRVTGTGPDMGPNALGIVPGHLVIGPLPASLPGRGSQLPQPRVDRTLPAATNRSLPAVPIRGPAASPTVRSSETPSKRDL